MKKAMILYYSRTGTTKKVAERLANDLDADIEEVVDMKSRAGPLGYVTAGRDAMKKRLTNLEPLKSDVSKYDLVVIGTPIWAWTMTPAIRTLLTEQGKNLKNVAFFCTMGGSGDDKSFEVMEKLSQNPIATLTLLTKEVNNGSADAKIEEFEKKLK